MRKYNEKVVNFLAQPENLEFAYEIWERFPEAIHKLTIDFWKELRDILQKRLFEEEYDGKWALECPQYEDEWAEDCTGITVKKLGAKESAKSLSLSFKIQHEPPQDEPTEDEPRAIGYGLKWSRDVVKKSWPLKVRQLVNDIADMEYGEVEKPSASFAFWKYCTPPELNDAKGLLDISEGRKAPEIADEFWTFFKRHAEAVSDANLEIEELAAAAIS